MNTGVGTKMYLPNHSEVQFSYGSRLFFLGGFIG